MTTDADLLDDAPDYTPRQTARLIKALWSTCMGLIALILGLGFWIAHIEFQSASTEATMARHVSETQDALIQVDAESRAMMQALVTANTRTDSLAHELHRANRRLLNLRRTMSARLTALERADSLARHP